MADDEPGILLELGDTAADPEARALIAKLALHWVHPMVNLGRQLGEITAISVLCSALLSYLGHFVSDEHIRKVAAQFHSGAERIIEQRRGHDVRTQ